MSKANWSNYVWQPKATFSTEPLGTMYGWTRLVVVDAPEGTVKMFTTAKWTDDFAEGDRVVVSGTVKAHDEYQGHRQTMITRPKGAAA